MNSRIIGVTGGSASGKSTLARLLGEQLSDQRVAVLAIDRFYHGAPIDSWDAPEAIDHELLFRVVDELAEGRDAKAPVYDFSKHARAGYENFSADFDFLVIEGLFTMHWEEIRRHLAMRVFIDCPADIRLARRMKRDIIERDRDCDNVLEQYLTSVRPMHERYVIPQQEHADIVVDGEVLEAELQRLLKELRAQT